MACAIPSLPPSMGCCSAVKPPPQASPVGLQTPDPAGQLRGRVPWQARTHQMAQLAWGTSQPSGASGDPETRVPDMFVWPFATSWGPSGVWMAISRKQMGRVGPHKWSQLSPAQSRDAPGERPARDPPCEHRAQGQGQPGLCPPSQCLPVASQSRSEPNADFGPTLSSTQIPGYQGPRPGVNGWEGRPL